MRYLKLENQLYNQSWKVVGEVSRVVEAVFQYFGIVNRQRFFFIRGAYPFYIVSSAMMLCFVNYFMPADFKNDWLSVLMTLFCVKFLFTLLLVIIPPSFLENDSKVETYIRNCRMDL
jgi:hypothetical protein